MKQSYSSIIARTRFAAALGLLALLAAPAAHAQIISSTPKLEAENPAVATIYGDGAKAVTTIVGYSGAGYVDYNGSDSGVAFKFSAPAAGFYDIVIRYESQYDFKKGDLVVNGGARSEIYFNSTKTGAAFRSTTPRRIMLKAGDNEIKVEKGYNYYGIDYIQIAASAANASLTPAATTGRIEAEAGQLFAAQAFVLEGDATAHSGASYVSGFSDVKTVGSSITLPVNVATAGVYLIAVGARNTYTDKREAEKQFDVVVNTTDKITTSLGAADDNFKSYAIGKYNLTAGINTIVITSQTGYLDVDYVDVTATTIGTATKASVDAQKAFAVYPNPSNGQNLRVRLESATARDASFELVNSLGQRVLSVNRNLKAGTNQLELSTGRVAAGMYQLVVRSGDQPVLSRRVVISE